MEAIQEFLTFLIPYGHYSYLVMFAVLIACGFGFPMPEDVILITGGILASYGVNELYLVNITCMLGVMIGDGTVFTIGKKFGPSVKQTWLFRMVMSEAIDKRIQGLFDKYHDRVIFMGRFMPGLRTPIFLTAGTYGVPLWKFLAIDGFAALISVPVWVWVGFVFGKNLELLEQKISQFQYGFYGVLAIVVVLVVAFTLIKKRIVKGSSSSA